MQLHGIIKSVKSRCGDNDILEKSSMSYFRELIKWVNKREDKHEDQKKVVLLGFVKVSRLGKTEAS